MQLVDRDDALEVLESLRVAETREFGGSAQVNVEFVEDQGVLINNTPAGKDVYIAMCQNVGIPKNYASKVPVELMAPHINHFSQDKSMKMAIGTDGYAMSIVRPEAAILNPIRVFETVEDTIGPIGSLRYSPVIGSPTHFKFSIWSEDEVPLGENDPFCGGISINASHADKFGLEAIGSVMRLVCTNGAYAFDQIYKASRKYGATEVYDWLQEVTVEAWNALDSEYARIRGLSELVLEDHQYETYQRALTYLSVPRDARDAMDAYVMENGINTVRDLYDAITFVGSNEIDPNDARLAQRMMESAAVLVQNPHVCPNCHRPMEDD